jgi:hypothetical protein
MGAWHADAGSAGRQLVLFLLLLLLLLLLLFIANN